MSTCTIKPSFAPSSVFGFDKTGSLNTPSEMMGSTTIPFGGFPTTFGGNTTYGGNWPTSSTFENTWTPSTFGGNFDGFPSTFGGFGGYPSTFGGNFGGFPTSFGGFGGYPSTFGGYEPWMTRFGGFDSYPWTRFGTSFGGYENMPWSRFGGNFPYSSRFGSFGGYPSTYGYPTTSFGGYPSYTGYETMPWARFGGNFGGFPSTFGGFGGYPSTFGGNFGGFPSTFGGFGGYPSTFGGFSGYEAMPWGRFGNTGLFNELTNFENMFMNNFDSSLRTVEREMYNLAKMFNFGNVFGPRPTGSTGKAFTSTMAQLPSRPTSSIEYFTFQNPIRFDAQGNRNLYLCFDLPSFKPEEVTVTLYAKANPAYIEVIASHDVKQSPKEHAVKRTYERKYFFPADLCLSPADIAKLEVKSHFTPEGVLVVEAALPRLTTEQMVTINKAHRCLPAFSAPVKTEKKDI